MLSLEKMYTGWSRKAKQITGVSPSDGAGGLAFVFGDA